MRSRFASLIAALAVITLPSMVTGQDVSEPSVATSASNEACDCLPDGSFCDSACCDVCDFDFYGGCCEKGRLFGLFAPSDCRFSDFISPMTNPVYFEDPRNLTEARVIFLNNQIPGAVLGGGPVQLLATQLRAAITERLSVIATKDGYIFAGDDAPDINGWANVNLGLKYNFYADAARQELLSAGFRCEMPACCSACPASCAAIPTEASVRP